jgi:hypothetical protein
MSQKWVNSFIPMFTISSYDLREIFKLDSGLIPRFSVTQSNSCRLSGFILTTNTFGKCSVTASSDGNANFLPISMTIDLGINLLPQILTSSNIPGSLYVSQLPYRLSATSSSGLPVVFSINGTPTNCDLKDNTIIYNQSTAGNCAFAYSVSGNDVYAPRSFAFNLRILDLALQTIASSNLPGRVFLSQYPYTLNVTLNTGQPVTFNYNGTPTNCILNGNVVTYKGNSPSFCQFIMEAPAIGNYARFSGTFRIETILKPPQYLTSSNIPSRLSQPQIPFTLSGTSLSGQPVSFFLNGTTSCTMNGNTITSAPVGRCAFFLQVAETDEYAAYVTTFNIEFVN